MDLRSTTGPQQPPRLALALALALFAASIGAGVVQHLAASCGGCMVQEGPWTLVAPMGVLGYGALATLGWSGRPRFFTVGAAVAAGVHTVLVAAMLMRGRICPLCVAAAILAGALFVVVLVRSRSRLKMIACGYLPAVILAAGPISWALAQERAADREQEAFARALQGPRPQDRITIQVFEQDHCGYCRDFREFTLPRLEQEFRGRIQVRFLPAIATAWVRRTPTIAIEGGAVYEGFPEDYADFRAAVERALAARK